MGNLNDVLQQLRDERGRTQQQLQKLDSAIAVLEGLGSPNNSHVARRGPGGRRSLSASARARIAAAQRARWARVRQQRGGKGKTGARRMLSADARRRIAAAQKARWAKFRAQKKAA
jgi:hypothetical protein